MIDPNIGTEVKRRRNNEGWSQVELAARADVGVAFLKQIELGNQQPTVMTLFKLALALDTTPDKLIMPSWETWKNLPHID